MKKITFENVYQIIDEFVPEFKDHKDYSMWYKDNPYLHIGNFGRFLVEKINNQEIEIVKKIFNFINNVFASSEIGEDIKTMFHIQIFEILPDSNRTINLCKKLLKGEALAGFKGVLEDFHPKD